MTATPAKFRKKPVEIDAIQWDGTRASALAIKEWADRDAGQLTINFAGSDHTSAMAVVTLEGEMRAQPGDWIIRGVQGEFYPCKPGIFAETYDSAQAKAMNDDDVVARTKAALAALDSSTYGGSAEQGALRQIARENTFIRAARSLMPEMVSEVEKLQDAIESIRDIATGLGRPLHHMIGDILAVVDRIEAK